MRDGDDGGAWCVACVVLCGDVVMVLSWAACGLRVGCVWVACVAACGQRVLLRVLVLLRAHVVVCCCMLLRVCCIIICNNIILIYYIMLFVSLNILHT